MNKKKLLPLRRKDKLEKNQDDEDILNSAVPNQNIISNSEYPPRAQISSKQVLDFPEFLKEADNEQYYQSYIRIRQRHLADGAVSLNIEEDDIANQNIELYENKGINIELPHINEHSAKSKEYFIESSSRNKFSKISKLGGRISKQNEPLFKKKLNKDSSLSRNPLPNQITKEIERTTEDEMFSLFDVQLTQIILKSSNKVALIFLFAQGLLAGISLIHLLLLFEYNNFKDFLMMYSYTAREIFNFTHAFTFGSLVGNGIKFIAAYKRYKFSTVQYLETASITSMKKSMIFSGIILSLFTFIFAIEMYLSSYIPAIMYSKYTTTVLITQTQFDLFAVLYIICNIVAIINFILNIFDIKIDIEEPYVDEVSNVISDNQAIESEETRDNTIDGN